jgi:hypothetical protein
VVAVKGKGWQLAPSLLLIVEQFDKVYPTRDRRSDGSIGDQAHASRSSDHNPYDGFVHAVDIDEDIATGRDLKAFAEQLEASRDARIRYVIYEGRILKAYASNGKPAWSWHKYDGPNAHEQHLHLSIDRTAAARDDLRPWPLTPTEEPDMQSDERQALFDVRYLLITPISQALTAIRGTVQNIAAEVEGAEPVDVDIDEAKIAEIILRTLTPEAIAKALGTAQAKAVADEIHKRLES